MFASAMKLKEKKKKLNVCGAAALKSDSFWLSKIFKGVALFDCIHYTTQQQATAKDLFKMQPKSSVHLSLHIYIYIFFCRYHHRCLF